MSSGGALSRPARPRVRRSSRPPAPRVARRAVAVLCGVSLAAGACGTSGEERAEEDVFVPEVPSASTGDVCDDEVGDLRDDLRAAEGTLQEPAGIDLVRAEAELQGASGELPDLEVRFDVAGDVREAPDPTFMVLHGPPGSVSSWEVVATARGDDWSVDVVTYEPFAQADARSVSRPVDVDVDVLDDGAALEFTVPGQHVPPPATLIWMFGSRAEVGGRVVFDDCHSFSGEPGEIPLVDEDGERIDGDVRAEEGAEGGADGAADEPDADAGDAAGSDGERTDGDVREGEDAAGDEEAAAPRPPRG